jgi:hypothetical protein
MRLPLNGFGALALLLAVTTSACAGNMQPLSVNDSKSPTNNETLSPPPTMPENPPSIDGAGSSIDAHQLRYPLKDTHTKLVDNRGNGFAALYGVRNFRAVLNGVVYRGGANNAYNKYGARDNNNPLPTLGLQNLCKEGFSAGVYLYATNYSTAPHELDCQSNIDQSKNHFSYKQYNPTTNAGITAIFDAVMKSISDPSVGPVYLHCWNGWHASGLASALVLRQFCGMSADAAAKYWDLNTDGAPVDSSYSAIRDRIRAFQPKAGYQLTTAQKKAICPL